jgi:Fe-S cluster assembly protein SufD
VFVNGVHRADLSRVDALPDGVSLRSLAQALHEDAEPLRFLLDRRHREPGDAFTRLNAAFAADGVVLRVAPGVRVPTPVQLIFIGAPAGADVAWHVRNVVELGDGAALTLVERHFDTAAHARFATVVADHLVHAGAWLDHVLVQTTDEAATLIHRNRLELDADAEARVDVLELGGALARLDLDASLRGDRAHLRTRGVFAPRGRQHIDTRLLIRHLGRDTRSAADWRGVADQRARGVFRGIIEVAQGADGTDAALSSRNLLLSAQAEIDTRPELDILTDAVKAAHGATVGQLDERALFYLRSRGIPSAQARAMLTAAFCESVFDDPAVPALREHLAALLAVRLRQGEEG